MNKSILICYCLKWILPARLLAESVYRLSILLDVVNHVEDSIARNNVGMNTLLDFYKETSTEMKYDIGNP